MDNEENSNYSTGGFDIIRGAHFNDYDEVNGALDIDPRCIGNVDHLGRTALHIAAQRGFQELLEHLSKQDGADPTKQDILKRNVLDASWEAANPGLSRHIAHTMFPGVFDDISPD